MLTDADVFQQLGEAGFDRLVTAFYARVSVDEVIGPMYPPEDLEGARIRLRDFLIQRFGGPSRYSDQRGHPRLRMRHGPFAIDRTAAERWLMIMRAAMKEVGIGPEVGQVLWPYFVSTATHMINVGE
ncbi:MAG: glbO [Thermoleophilia bacterium]|nr:glbO [Thermoleophilia bacterium]